MILVENGRVIAIMEGYDQKENGKLINGTIYPFGEVFEVDVPEELQNKGYDLRYSEEKGIYRVQTQEESDMNTLIEQNLTLMDALATIYEELMNKGV